MSFRAHLLASRLSASELARRLGVAHSTVLRWAAGEMRVSGERAVQIERASGIPRHVVRPDLWSAPTAADDRKAA